MTDTTFDAFLSEVTARAAVSVYTARRARMAAGIAGVLGFVATVATLALERLGRIDLHPTFVLAASVAAVPLVYAVARVIARLRIELAGDAAPELARRYERASLALPIAAMALLGPLFLHLVVWACAGDARFEDHRAASFDDWMFLSLMVVAVAQGALVVTGIVFAHRVSKTPTVWLALRTPVTGWYALLVTTGAAMVPAGIPFLLIPPLLVFVTGLPIVPPLFFLLHASAVRERNALAV